MKHQVVVFVFSLLIFQPISGRPNLVSEEHVAIEDVFQESQSQADNTTSAAQSAAKLAETRILYSGYQLWKTYIENDKSTKILEKLREKEEITFWGGNLTSIDMVLKPEYVEEIRQLLSQEHIKYQVLFQDLQKAIDEENPPLSEETSDRHAKIVAGVFGIGDILPSSIFELYIPTIFKNKTH